METQRIAPVVVGVMGGSASGKTTFANALSEALSPVSSVILHQDHYFKDWSAYPPEIREGIRTANHPDAVRWELLVEHIRQLAEWQSVPSPRRNDSAVVHPAHVLIVEGHLIFWSEELRRRLDMKLFLDVDPHERVLRRLLRDVGTRSGSLEQAAAWYRRDVIPNFPVYTEPCKGYADLVVPFHRENPVALRAVVAGIRELLDGRGLSTARDSSPERSPGSSPQS